MEFLFSFERVKTYERMKDILKEVEFLDLERGGIRGSYDGLVVNGVESWTHLLTPGNNSLLHVVANSGEVDLASRMLSSLTNPSDVSSALLRQNTRGDTPLHCAARRGNICVLGLFISKIRNTGEEKMRLLTIMENKQGDTALHLAARNNHFEVVDMLMNENSYLGSIANNSGECPLYVAAYKGYLDITKRLVEATATGPAKMNALHAAASQGHLNVVDLLLDKRPELCRERDETGSTPLLCVASIEKQTNKTQERTSKCIIQKLLEQDIYSVMILDNNGLSALHVAAAVQRVDIIQATLEKRHDLWEVVDNTGKTFLHVAVLHFRRHVVKFVLKDLVNGVEELLNQPDDEGNTPLHLAVLNSDMYIVQMLLEDKRVVLDIINKKGQSPLDLAYSVLWENPRSELEMVVIIYVLKLCGMNYSPRRCDLDLKRRVEISVAKREGKWHRYVSNNVAIVAVLIAAVTFAAGFTLPGGYKNDAGPEQGTAALTRSIAFKVFLISDTLAMITSVIVIFFLYGVESIYHDVRFRAIITCLRLLACSVVEMIVAFVAGIYAVISAECLWLAILVCSLVGIIIPLAISTRMIWAYRINLFRLLAFYKRPAKKLNVKNIQLLGMQKKQ